MIEDGNGQSEVIAIGLLVDEDTITLNWFLETFKETNPSWPSTFIVMTDKDMKERQVFRKQFPHIDMKICAFHVRFFQMENNVREDGYNSKQS